MQQEIDATETSLQLDHATQHVNTQQHATKITLHDARVIADITVNTQLCPAVYRGKPQDAIIAIMWGAEINLKPMQALSSIYIVKGRPGMYTEAMMAMCLSSGQVEDIKESFDVQKGIATCIIKRRNIATPQESEFSVDDAKRAQLWGNAGPWTQYPKRMLKIRARALCLRDTFPDILKGIMSVEELLDMQVATAPTATATTTHTEKSASKKIDALLSVRAKNVQSDDADDDADALE